MNNRRYIYSLLLLMGMLSLMTACRDDTGMEPILLGADGLWQYWYTQTRSQTEQKTTLCFIL